MAAEAGLDCIANIQPLRLGHQFEPGTVIDQHWPLNQIQPGCLAVVANLCGR